MPNPLIRWTAQAASASTPTATRILTPRMAFNALRSGQIRPLRSEEGAINFLQNANLNNNSILVHYTSPDLESTSPGRYVLRHPISLDDPNLSVSFINPHGITHLDTPIDSRVREIGRDILNPKFVEPAPSSGGAIPTIPFTTAARIPTTHLRTNTPLASEPAPDGFDWESFNQSLERTTPTPTVPEQDLSRKFAGFSNHELVEYARAHSVSGANEPLTDEQADYIANKLINASVDDGVYAHLNFASNTGYEWIPGVGWKVVAEYPTKDIIARINNVYSKTPRGARLMESLSSDSFPLLLSYVARKQGTGKNQLSIIPTGSPAYTNPFGKGVLFEDLFSVENRKQMSPELQNLYSTFINIPTLLERERYITTVLESHPDIGDELLRWLEKERSGKINSILHTYERIPSLSGPIEFTPLDLYNVKEILRSGHIPIYFRYPGFYVQKHKLGGTLPLAKVE